MDKARPYAAAFESKVYRPSETFARSNYEKYGAAHVARTQAYGQREWDRRAKPQLEKARERASTLYGQFLAPHVDHAYNAVSPRVKQAKAAGVDQYQTVVVPTYQKAQPYLQQLYVRAYHFVTDVALPYASWAADTALIFVQRKVWPPIRILYGENVLPQLVKIKERLASYRDGKRLQGVMESVETTASQSSSIASAESASPSSNAASASSTVTSKTSKSSASSTAGTTQPPTAEQQARQVSEDLKIWQTKFAKAADQGAEGLRERISDIANKQMTSQAKGTGEALLVSLEETAKASIEELEVQVNAIVGSLPGDNEDELPEEDEQAAKDKTRNVIRAAGKKVKDAAEHLRAWRRNYDSETDALIKAASDSTLEVVDNIRDLGLQEIGMRWASMDDGVSYKDWSEYHAMRKTFAEWRGTVSSVVTGHDGPARAKSTGEDIENRGMAVAEDAAKELARLKEVAVWKLEARDASDDFSTRYAPAGAARVARKVQSKASDASEAVAGTTSRQGTIESVVSAASSMADPVAASASSVQSAAGSKAASVVSPIAEGASSMQESAASGASSISSKFGSSGADAAAAASASSSSMLSSASSVATGAKSSATVGRNGESETRAAVSSVTAGAKSASSALGNKIQAAGGEL